MPISNYMLQDILGAVLAFFIYFLVMLIPGYVVGWSFNIFNFRNRLISTQYLIGIALSNSICPVIMFLCARLVSIQFAILVSLVFFIVWLGVLLSQLRNKYISANNFTSQRKYVQLVLVLGGVWVIFSILRLVDIQIGQHLYYSVASYDLTTRVSVVDAMTRTGVPPINPGYYPGHATSLTLLYYLWYVLGSMVDILGGTWVSPYQAMIASIAWACIIALATTAVYIRLREGSSKSNPYQSAIVASQLYLISGLDFIPVVSQMLYFQLTFGKIYSNGQIEGWNTPIISWMNAFAWVPHHVAAVFACITGLMIFVEAIKGKTSAWIATLIAGLAFASAIGLSVWVPFVFSIFWVVWMLILIVKQETRKFVVPMLLSGVIALITISPFIIDIVTSGGSGGGAGLPIALYVRPFVASLLFDFKIKAELNLFNFLTLPINYLFELGFFFLTGIVWLKKYYKKDISLNPYHNAEAALLFVVTIFLSFVHSTIIKINDLGIRPWLLGQFVLLIWATDVIVPWLGKNIVIKPSLFKPLSSSWKFSSLFRAFFAIGFLTTLLEVTIVRFWPMAIDRNIVGLPNDLSPDTHLGERTYFAQQTYDYIQEHISGHYVIQYNPTHELDRPSGLYGNHQMAVADRTAYGVSQEEFDRLRKGIGQIFQIQNVAGWEAVDVLCKQYSINYIIVDDTDPVWSSLSNLAIQRPAIFENQYFAIFNCGIK